MSIEKDLLHRTFCVIGGDLIEREIKQVQIERGSSVKENDFLLALVYAIAKNFTDSEFQKLDHAVKIWYNECVTIVNDGKTETNSDLLPPFPSYPKLPSSLTVH